MIGEHRRFDARDFLLAELVNFGGGHGGRGESVNQDCIGGAPSLHG